MSFQMRCCSAISWPADDPRLRTYLSGADLRYARLSHANLFRVIGDEVALYDAVLIGAQLPFFSGYLEDRGFSAATIGVLGAAALAFRVFAGPAIALDVDGRANARGATIFWAFAVAAPAAFLPWTHGFALAAASLIMMCAYGALTPLIDAGALASDRRGALHYGQTRSWGSAAFIAAAIATGALVGETGLVGAAYAMAASGVAALLLSFALPRAAGAAREATPPALRRKHALDLVRSRTFIVFLAASGLAQGAHGGYYAFTILDWRAQGIDPFVIGLLWATGTFSEIFLLTRGRGLARRFGPIRLIAALLPRLRQRERAVIVNVTSGLDKPLWETLHDAIMRLGPGQTRFNIGGFNFILTVNQDRRIVINACKL